MSAPPIYVRDIRKSFGEGKKRINALQGISFSIEAGEIFCLLGPNGSGKTTTMKITCGLIEPDSGEVKIYGGNISMKQSLLKEIGAVFEGNRNIYPYLSAFENIKYYSRICGFDGKKMLERTDELLTYFGIVDRKNEPVTQLSLGTQQKVALCCALITDPPILLLDEPTSGLDVLTKRELINTIDHMRNDGKSIFLMTHQMDVAERIADKIAILNKGKIIMETTPKELTGFFTAGEYRMTLYENPSGIPKEILANYDLVLDGPELVLRNTEQKDLVKILQNLDERGFHLLTLSKNLSLEDSFIRLIEGEDK